MKKNQDRFIKWPVGEEMEKTRKKFSLLLNEPFPNVVGCLGASYIPITGSRLENDIYCTNDGYTAVILQAVCSSNLQFINIFAGWPGSASNATVWQNSALYRRLMSDPESLLPSNTHLIANISYPLDHFLVVPYKDNRVLTPKHKAFNKTLNSTLVLIDEAFKMLKSRCRRLNCLDMNRMDRIPSVIVAGCALHNICIELGDMLEPDQSERNSIGDSHLTHATPKAVLKRDTIANSLKIF